jgi:hypothetical protein
MWDDCPVNAKDLFIHLITHGDVPVSGVGKTELACLIERGFARPIGSRLTASCRMLKEHIQGVEADVGSVARLFGSWEDYRANIRGVLERRLSHIRRFDDRLFRLVMLAIGDIPQSPDDCLNSLTNIEDLALDLIWQREFGQEKTIPQEIIDYWNSTNPADKLIQRLRAGSGKGVPDDDRGLQCGILQLLTGSRKGFESKAKYVSKNTYTLINALHSFRNRNQHSAGQEMHVGVAVVAIMGCVELLSGLERELV